MNSDENSSFSPEMNDSANTMRHSIGEPLIPGNIYAQPASSAPIDTPTPKGPASPEFQPGEPHRTSRLRERWQDWRSALSTLLLFLMAPLIALFIMAFVIQSYQVEGESMETTLQNGDRLIVDKLPRTIARLTHHEYIPHRGDIIIFNQTGVFDSTSPQEKQLIKRVIGLPGDHVVIKDGYPTIYNSLHPNGFNPDTSDGYKITAPTTPGTADVTLSKDQIFVMGDNRTNSEDSRFFGPVNVQQIVGKLVLRLMPLNKAERF